MFMGLCVSEVLHVEMFHFTCNFRAEERRRQRRETERLARILAESLHVAVENFIARLNQEPGNDDRHHDDHPR